MVLKLGLRLTAHGRYHDSSSRMFHSVDRLSERRFWIGAACRRDAGAGVIAAFNDTAWFGFLLGWVFLSLEMIAVALVTLSESSPRRFSAHGSTRLRAAH